MQSNQDPGLNNQNTGNTPFHHVADQLLAKNITIDNAFSAMKALVENQHADINGKNNAGLTVLAYLANHDSKCVNIDLYIKMIEDLGANADIKIQHSTSFLFYILRAHPPGSDEMAASLISKNLANPFYEAGIQGFDSSTLKINKIIGFGAYSTVYACDKNLALKKVPGKDKQTNDFKGFGRKLRRFYNEVTIMHELSKNDAPNIIRFHGYEIEKNPLSLNIIMELVLAGSLANAFKDQKKPDWGTLLKLMSDLMTALVFLHDYYKITHNDLKPHNIFLNDFQQLKVGDFDLAYKGKKSGWRGTGGYLAPEVREKGNSPKADIFSATITSADLTRWKLVTEDYFPANLSEEEQADYYKPEEKRPPLAKDCPPGIAKIFGKGWLSDPDKRHCARQMKEAIELERKNYIVVK